MRMLGNNAIVEYISNNDILAKGINGLDIVRVKEWQSSDDTERNKQCEYAIQDAEAAIRRFENAYNADPKHRHLLELNMHTAIREAQEAMYDRDNAHTRVDDNMNYLETNPQIAAIIHPNVNLPYIPGDWVFLHYMAWEWAEKTEDGHHLIDTDFILFQILDDGSFKLLDDLYLGEAVINDEEITPSGIILSTAKRDNLKVKLTHLAPNNQYYSVGDTVLSIDKNNYAFNYNGKEYIKLMEHEIVGKINGN